MRINRDEKSNKVHVVLTNGDSGTAIRVISSIEIIESRIMKEDQHAENKLNFGEDKMRTDVIPKTVQSFLNSDGGYLYIGIRDTGNLEERLVGLDYDLDLIQKEENKKNQGNLTNDRLCDRLELRVRGALKKRLRPDAHLGSLIQIDFPIVRGVQIMQINIGKSPHPWFFRHITKGNKDKRFKVQFENEKETKRYLSDFYIRDGNGKKMLETMEDFYNYARFRFISR